MGRAIKVREQFEFLLWQLTGALIAGVLLLLIMFAGGCASVWTDAPPEENMPPAKAIRPAYQFFEPQGVVEI